MDTTLPCIKDKMAVAEIIYFIRWRWRATTINGLWLARLVAVSGWFEAVVGCFCVISGWLLLKVNLFASSLRAFRT